MQAGGQSHDAAGVIAPPPLIYAGALAAGLGLDAISPRPARPRGLRRSAGAMLVLSGAGLAASFVLALRGARTPLDPYKPTTAVVTTGPYRFTRNPAYLAMSLTYSGIAMLRGARWPFVTLVPALIVVDRGVIAREERYLERKFGQVYLDYKQYTRRWL